MPNAVFAYSMLGAGIIPVVHKFPVATTQTLVEGDVVVLSSGQVAKASTTFGRCLGVMAQASASAAADTLVDVWVAAPSQVWIMTADADATTYILDSRAYDLTSAQLVATGDTSGGSISIIKIGSAVTQVYVAFTACEFG
jgi:hypothetical protein